MYRLIAICLIVSINSVNASDLAKEKRWADQVIDSILDGDAVWLKVEDLEILSIFTEAEEESERALIVIHGTGVHPNWDQVIHPVRVEMPAYGWHTLSIQMPILPNEASHDEYAPLFPEVIPRIDAAVNYLESQGCREIVLVAHSLGSLMASYYLASKPKNSVKGLIAIGMPGNSAHDNMNSLITLKSMRVPVLDLYGSDDLPEVLNTVQARRQAASMNSFDQVEVDGANHFFDDQNEVLIDQVNGWLNKHF